jgi:AcrR family transcriptional regulator
MPNSRSYLNPEDRLRTLIEAAHRLFSEGGFDAITNVAVAQEAGVSRALVYSFFPDNASLRLAFFESAMKHYMSLMYADDDPTMTPLDRTASALRVLVTMPLGDLLALKAVINAHGNEQLHAMQEILRRFTYERWQPAVPFDAAPAGLFPAVWLFVGICVSMAISVQRAEMTLEGAESLLVALTSAALEELARRL